MFFDETRILLCEQTFSNKEEVIHYLTHIENNLVINPDAYEKDVLEREGSFPTYTIDGVAIPHAKTNAVKKAFVVFARLAVHVHWGSEAGEDARIIFLIGVPEGQGAGAEGNLHLKILATLSKKLIHESFRNALLTASSKQELLDLFNEIEEGLS